MSEEVNFDEIKISKVEPAHVDERGVISDILNAKLNHVGLITFKKGVVRANHYHKLSTQHSYTYSGKFEVLIAKADNPTVVKKFIVDQGEIITIPPYYIHNFKAVEDSVMIDMVSESREGTGYEDDVIRIKIEDPEEAK